MGRKAREYAWLDSDPPCASCGTGFDPEEVQPDGRSYRVAIGRSCRSGSLINFPVRELIEECCGDEERHICFRDWNVSISKSCVFHKGCLKMLIQHFISGAVPLDKLANVVEEAPWPQYRACKSRSRSFYRSFAPTNNFN